MPNPKLITQWFSIGCFVLSSVSVVATPIGAEAKTKNLPRTFSVKKEAPAKKFVLNGERKRLINEAFIERFVYHSNKYSSFKEYEAAVLPYMRPQAKAELRKALAKADFDIDVTQKGSQILYKKNGELILVVEWPDVAKPEFIVNGITWAYKPHQPIDWQLAILERKLSHKNSPRDYSWALFFPKAHANVGAAAAGVADDAAAAAATVAPGVAAKAGLAVKKLGSTIGSQYGSILINTGITSTLLYGKQGTCWVIDGVGHKSSELALCRTVQDELEEMRKKDLQKTGSIDVVSDQKTKLAENSTTWLARAEQCPSVTDKTKTVYIANFVELELIEGKKVPKKESFPVRIELDADGKPKSGFTGEPGADLTAPGAITKATNVFKFDEQKLLAEVGIPNVNYNPADVGSEPYVPINMTAPDETLVPEHKARRDKMRSLTNGINQWMTFCMLHDQAKEYFKERRNNPDMPQGPDIRMRRGEEMMNQAPQSAPVIAPAPAPGAAPVAQ